MNGFFEEFKKFALRGNAVDLAVGIVIGAAFNSVVNSLVRDIITPPIGFVMGGFDFSALAIPLNEEVAITYGLFIEALVSFTITALALFLVVRGMNKIAHLRHAPPPAPPPPPQKSQELIVLEEIRDTLQSKDA